MKSEPHASARAGQCQPARSDGEGAARTALAHGFGGQVEIQWNKRATKPPVGQADFSLKGAPATAPDQCPLPPWGNGKLLCRQ